MEDFSLKINRRTCTVIREIRVWPYYIIEGIYNRSSLHLELVRWIHS